MRSFLGAKFLASWLLGRYEMMTETVASCLARKDYTLSWLSLGLQCFGVAVIFLVKLFLKPEEMSSIGKYHLIRMECQAAQGYEAKLACLHGQGTLQTEETPITVNFVKTTTCQ